MPRKILSLFLLVLILSMVSAQFGPPKGPPWMGGKEGQPFGPPGIGPPGMGPGIGGPPEMLCELSDEDIIETFIGFMDEQFEGIEDEIMHRCKTDASNIMSGLNMIKFESAKCLANAALDCASKQKLVENCNTIKANPEKIAKFMVGNLCRQFGVKPVENKLYDIADKWYTIDPALAYQLGETVDSTVEDKEKLNIFSRIFGDPVYAEKMKAKSDQLKTIKERLEERKIQDVETLKTLEEQAKELKEESDKFGNFWAIIPRLFGGK